MNVVDHHVPMWKDREENARQLRKFWTALAAGLIGIVVVLAFAMGVLP